MRRLILAKVGNDPNNMELTRTATFGGNERLDFRADIEKCFWYRRFLKTYYSMAQDIYNQAHLSKLKKTYNDLFDQPLKVKSLKQT